MQITDNSTNNKTSCFTTNIKTFCRLHYSFGKDLLDFSQIEAGKMWSKQNRFSLKNTIDTVSKTSNLFIHKKTSDWF
jgi:hypothetical protein